MTMKLSFSSIFDALKAATSLDRTFKYVLCLLLLITPFNIGIHYLKANEVEQARHELQVTVDQLLENETPQ